MRILYIIYDRFAALTLDNVGDHEGGATIVAGQASGGEVLLQLEGEEVPGGDGDTLKPKESTEGDREHVLNTRNQPKATGNTF